MKLAVIADTKHFLNGNDIYTIAPVRRQLERISTKFEEVILCTPQINDRPSQFSKYEGEKYRHIQIPFGGGQGIIARIKLLYLFIKWFFIMSRVLMKVNFVHVRCPSAIGFFALIVTKIYRKNVYAMFAGNWNKRDCETIGSRIQKWMLNTGYFARPVTIYGEHLNQKDHLYSFFSPSFTTSDWLALMEVINEKKMKNINEDLRFISVGHFDENKRQYVAINLMYELVRRGYKPRLELYGDGPKKKELQTLCKKLKLQGRIIFNGYCSLEEINKANIESDFHLLFSITEGFPKVIPEAMMCGTIPIVTAVGALPEMIRTDRGVLINELDIDAIADKIVDIIENPVKRKCYINRGRVYTYLITLEQFERKLQDILYAEWKLKGYPC